MTSQSFFFYDYETTGIDPKSDRILQFAGVRTDSDFNIIADPIVIYSKLSTEIIPNPEALLVTGITPDVLSGKGLLEPEFIKRIFTEFSTPNTCVVGYNNIRFDDEFTRYAFYRNFYDPYAREWQNNNSRWDIIDVVRMCAALRSDGLKWPVKEDGHTVSFKLEDLTKINNLVHLKAHDALSDVYATIEVIKLIRKKQPKLINFLLKTRDKKFVADLLNVDRIYNNNIKLINKPVVNSTGMVKSEFYATSVFLPLLVDPSNKNCIVTWDLRYNPEILLSLSDGDQQMNINDKIRELLYSTADDLAPENRLHLKSIHCNKAPAVAPLNTMDDSSFERLQLNRSLMLKYAELIINNKDKFYNTLQDFYSSQADYFDNPEINSPQYDAEQQLYAGFIPNTDRYLCNRVLLMGSDMSNKLRELQDSFSDPRLAELLFRYRARNYHSTLSENEKIKWQRYKSQRVNNAHSLYSISLEDFKSRCADLLSRGTDETVLKCWLNYYDTCEELC